PENSLYFRIEKGPLRRSFDLNSPEIQQIKTWAIEKKVHIVLGSVAFKDSGGVDNSTLWVSPSGEVERPYSKIHLFDVDVVGHAPVRESDNFKAGSEVAIKEIDGWKFGFSICYDLRFSELYSFYARQSVDALLIPSAFLRPTGEAHWEVLVRARAIESQAFVIAAAQGGEHKYKDIVRETYGHSLVVAPWGNILAGSNSKDETPVVCLQSEWIDKARAQIPMEQHRKTLSTFVKN
ncbi:MAG: carbon-nitrogen hydrolase family protein, partial [Bdellovibrionales bacterium]|nr:carbon-nitrogen hydrolase family protein [Bdellovibrionales bacterium]